MTKETKKLTWTYIAQACLYQAGANQENIQHALALLSLSTKGMVAEVSEADELASDIINAIGTQLAGKIDWLSKINYYE